MSTIDEIKDRLHQAIGTWREWPVEQSEYPTVIRELNGGLTNHSYLISCPELYSLRLNNPSSSTLGVARDQEYKVLQALRPLNIAPKLIFENTDFSLFKYVHGRPWTNDTLADPKKRELLSALIDSYQSTLIDLPRLNYPRYIQNYVDQLATLYPTILDQIRSEIDIFIKELKVLMNGDWQPVLCHHDLIPENIIELDSDSKKDSQTGIILLDWEYAGLGHPEFDSRYLEHCRRKTMELSPNTLKNGDTLDKLIYWLNTLWSHLSRT